MGVGLSASVSYVWTLVPNSNTFALSDNPLAFLEHYHYGLLSFNVAKHVKRAANYKPYLNGFGAGMIAIEASGPQPFGIGKVPWQVMGNIAVTSALIFGLLL